MSNTDVRQIAERLAVRLREVNELCAGLRAINDEADSIIERSKVRPVLSEEFRGALLRVLSISKDALDVVDHDYVNPAPQTESESMIVDRIEKANTKYQRASEIRLEVPGKALGELLNEIAACVAIVDQRIEALKNRVIKLEQESDGTQ